MKKAVLISIRPEWCALIASGKKTIEVRRTRPDLPTPFKCYIYCTKERGNKDVSTRFYESEDGCFYSEHKNYAAFLTGTIIGEFICDEISDYVRYGGALSKDRLRYVRMDRQFYTHSINFAAMCMSEEAFEKYAAGRKMHGWHISGLTIYERPRELTDFWRPCAPGDPDAKALCIECRRDAENFCGQERIMRAPQSWCYVEEI